MPRKFGGGVLLPGDPDTALGATPRQYVDLRELSSNKNVVNGYCPLDSNARVPSANLYSASSTQTGIVRLTGDLGGTSTSPTVPGLANKAPIASPTFTGTVTAPRIVTPPVVLTDAATIATDASLGDHFRVTITAARTLGVPTNPIDGQRALWEITASGGDWLPTFTIDSAGAFAFGTSITVAIITAVASGTTDFVGAIYNSIAARWRVIAYVKGY
jgi:hypothetical protein